jgi:hypothetical protein
MGRSERQAKEAHVDTSGGRGVFISGGQQLRPTAQHCGCWLRAALRDTRFQAPPRLSNATPPHTRLHLHSCRHSHTTTPTHLWRLQVDGEEASFVVIVWRVDPQPHVSQPCALSSQPVVGPGGMHHIRHDTRGLQGSTECRQRRAGQYRLGQSWWGAGAGRAPRWLQMQTRLARQSQLAASWQPPAHLV